MSEDKKVEKNKKKKARAVLVVFLKKLKGKCGSFAKAEEWDKFIKENLSPILQEFDGVIPLQWKEKINSAVKLKDKTKAAIDASCKLLQKNIKGLIKYLPKGGIFAHPLVKFVLGVAVGGGILVTVLKVIAVSVIIKNQGCQTIYPSVYSFIKIPGLSLPESPIVDGGSGTAKVPPVKFTVSVNDNRIDLQAFKMNFSFSLESTGINLVFNDQPLTGINVIDLGSQKTHTLDVNCR